MADRRTRVPRPRPRNAEAGRSPRSRIWYRVEGLIPMISQAYQHGTSMEVGPGTRRMHFRRRIVGAASLVMSGTPSESLSRDRQIDPGRERSAGASERFSAKGLRIRSAKRSRDRFRLLPPRPSAIGRGGGVVRAWWELYRSCTHGVFECTNHVNMAFEY